jgi:hypothetical protein
MKRKVQDDPSQTMLFADVFQNGNGFTIVPRKPTTEIDSNQAATVLGCARSTLNTLINSQKGQKYLRWRWMTERKGKRLFELDSVLAYREALRELD